MRRLATRLVKVVIVCSTPGTHRQPISCAALHQVRFVLAGWKIRLEGNARTVAKPFRNGQMRGAFAHALET